MEEWFGDMDLTDGTIFLTDKSKREKYIVNQEIKSPRDIKR